MFQNAKCETEKKRLHAEPFQGFFHQCGMEQQHRRVVIMLKNQYSDKVSHYFGSERHEMINFIPPGTQNLLEVGCGEGGFGANLKKLKDIKVTGIEPDENAAKTASLVLDRVLNLDIDAGISELLDSKFDCIVFNDVLEHLIDPWDSLQKIISLLAPSGFIVSSIPNIRYMPVFKDFVINGNWRYQRDGVMDKTHLRFFTKISIHDLFNLAGYEVTTLQGINGITFPWKYGILNALLGGKLEDTRYQQYACVARPASRQGPL